MQTEPIELFHEETVADSKLADHNLHSKGLEDCFQQKLNELSPQRRIVYLKSENLRFEYKITSMLGQFSKYNNWANSLLLDALIANSSLLPGSCALLFSHIVNAQTIWSCRINGITPSVSVWQLHDLESCKVLLEESENKLSQIENLEAIDATIVKYRISTGDYYETSVPDILLHVFNHGTYHRAQIAKEMKLHHIQPVNTDYIQFVRLQSAQSKK